MKHLLIVLFLLLLATGLFAQKGLFELAFGDSLAHCDSLITHVGLQANDKTGTAIVYYPEPETQYAGKLSRINLYLDKETRKLTGWVAYIFYPQTGDLEKSILTQMKALHGDKYEIKEDDYYGGRKLYTWTLDKNHYVEIGPSGDLFHVWYDTR